MGISEPATEPTINSSNSSGGIDLDSIFASQQRIDKGSLKLPTTGSGSFISRLTSGYRSISSTSHRSEATNATNDGSEDPSPAASKLILKPIHELTNLSQVVLHTAFSKFVRLADKKLEIIKSLSVVSEPDCGGCLRWLRAHEEFRLVKLLSRDVDADFDGALLSLGSIGRHCPGLLVDSLFTWRSVKFCPKPGRRPSKRKRFKIFKLEQRLCGFLDHVKLARSLDSCGSRLEEFSFGYLEALTAPLDADSANHKALYRVVGEVIYSLSNLRFASLSDRFVAALEQAPEDANGEKERAVMLVINTLKHLRLKIYPADSLEETAEFLLSCASFFRKTKNARLRRAYAEAFIDMLLPITPVLVAEVNFPVWVKAVDLLQAQANKLLQKLTHAGYALAFAVAVLGVAQKEVFQAKWAGLFELCAQRTRDKALRPAALGCLRRLVWVYLFRYPDTPAAVHKRLDVVYRLVLANPRRTSAPPNLLHLTNIVRYVLTFDIAYGLTNWLAGLLALDALASGGIDALQPDKVTIAIRAFLTLAVDKSRAARVPAFPADDEAEVGAGLLGDVDSKLQAPLGLILDALDQLLPALELSYGAMLVNEDRCRSAIPPYETTLLPLTGELVRTYPKLQVFSILYSRDKQPFFDLVGAWLDGLPILVPRQFSTPRVVDFTIRLLLHIDPRVSLAAGRALERLSAAYHLHIPVLRSLSKLIQKIKVQFIEVLAPIYAAGECEGLNLLKVFCRILTGWRGHLASLVVGALDRGDPDAALTWSLIEETEALGLLFLCSAYVPVRRCALDILAVISTVERAYEALVRNGDLSRLPIIDAIKSPEADLIVASQGGEASAFEIATSEEHQVIWTRSFPQISKLLLDRSPITTVLCRHMASSRLRQLHPTITALSETDDLVAAKDITPDTIMLEHWGRYLMFVCATVTYVADAQPTYAKRREQRGAEGIQSAKELFRLVFVLLSCANRTIRSTVVTALCQINHNIYRHFLEDLQPFVRIVQEDTKSRCATRDFVNRRRQDGFREGIAECLAKTASTMLEEQFHNDDSIAVQALPFVQDVFLFLGQPEVQPIWTWQELRIYFCELVDGVFTKLSLTRPTAMPFELRHGIFQLAERWCGHGAHRDSTRAREVPTAADAPEGCPDVARGTRASEVEALRRRLELASLRLMAVLCRGPIISSSASFDLPSLFRWIESLFNGSDPHAPLIAREALQALLSHNMDNPLLYEYVLHRCYALATPGYFLVLAETLLDAAAKDLHPPIALGKRVLLIAHKCGDADPSVRRAAHRLLRNHWHTRRFHPTLEDERLCGRVMHPLATVYKQARVQVSVGLSQHHPELVMEVVSEGVMRLPTIEANSRSALLQLLAPWVHAIRLTLDDGELSALSHALVTNLLCMVIKYSDQHPDDLERLWQALLTTEAPPETEAVLKFLIQVNLEKRNPQLIFYTKNVFIFICRTPVGPTMLEFLMASLTPASMVPQKPARRQPRSKHLSSPLFVASLDDCILTHTRRPAFSPGQLVLIFISDILLCFSSLTPHLPLLLHLGSCQAFDGGLLPAAIEDLTQPILPNLLIVLATHHTNSALVEEIRHLLSVYLSATTRAVSARPEALEALFRGTMAAMAARAAPLLELWEETASDWATACPIRSVARASFIIYRSFTLPLQPKGLTDIMARLAGTLSDRDKDIQNFAYEIILSLRSRMASIGLSGWPMAPGLFWFLVGCLNGYNEGEYQQCLRLLLQVVDGMLPADLASFSRFLTHLPDPLYIPSIEDVLIAGLSSLEAAPIACELLYKFLSPPQCALILDAQKVRLAILLYAFPSVVATALLGEAEGGLPHTFPLSADQLAEVADLGGCPNLSKSLKGLSRQRFRDDRVGLQRLLNGLREGFFPAYEREALQVVLGLPFADAAPLVQRRLKLCGLVMSAIDARHLEFAGEKVGGVAPLLRLLDCECFEDALEVVDLLTFSNAKAMQFRPDGVASLWAPLSEGSQGAEPERSDPTRWGVFPSQERQESTRSLLAAVAQALSLSLGVTRGQDPPTANGVGDHGARPLAGPHVISRSESPFQPPVMTDFYVELSASPRSYHPYKSSSFSHAYHVASHSCFKSSSGHHRNLSSLASLVDFYGGGCDVAEATSLYAAISDIDGYFASIPNPQPGQSYASADWLAAVPAKLAPSSLPSPRSAGCEIGKGDHQNPTEERQDNLIP
ncbi:Cell morphogenesis protein PAG1, partial [Massospora cicadina]